MRQKIEMMPMTTSAVNDKGLHGICPEHLQMFIVTGLATKGLQPDLLDVS